jgi:hypothetical protein
VTEEKIKRKKTIYAAAEACVLKYIKAACVTSFVKFLNLTGAYSFYVIGAARGCGGACAPPSCNVQFLMIFIKS